jgi:hypothetical protein
MNALVVYTSKYGNTEQIARAIGTSLAAHGTADVRAIGETDTGAKVSAPRPPASSSTTPLSGSVSPT